MTLPVSLPVLPTPPDEYDAKYFSSLLKNLEVYFRSCNTAGPTAASVVTVGSNRVNIYTGTGAPSVVAHIGSIYLRDDGGTSTTLYVKESGNGASTGWIAK